MSYNYIVNCNFIRNTSFLLEDADLQGYMNSQILMSFGARNIPIFDCSLENTNTSNLKKGNGITKVAQ